MIAASEILVSYPIAITVCGGIIALFAFTLRHAINTDKHLNGKRYVTEDKFEGMVKANDQAHEYISKGIDDIKDKVENLMRMVYESHGDRGE